MQSEILKATEVLKKGGTLLYPTDTIWGLGCDATSATAVDKIYKIKERDPSRSMLVLVADIRMAEHYLQELPDIAIQLFEISEDPLTLVLEGAVRLANNLPAKDGSIGMRIPRDEFCQALLRTFRKPIVSTSANLSGRPAASCYKEMDPALISRVDLVADWRRSEGPSKKASSVIRLGSNGQVEILRP